MSGPKRFELEKFVERGRAAQVAIDELAKPRAAVPSDVARARVARRELERQREVETKALEAKVRLEQWTKENNDARARRLNVDPEMLLPEGATCGDCCNFAYCHQLVGAESSNQFCDWAPSRFVEKKGGL